MDLAEIDWFGCRLNYLSFNGRFTYWRMTWPHHHHRRCLTSSLPLWSSFSWSSLSLAKQDNLHNQCNRCQLFILSPSHDFASWDSQSWVFSHDKRKWSWSWVNWRKIVLASVELNRLLPHSFRVTDCRPDKAWHLRSSGSTYKIDLKNKIFSLFSK